MCSKMYLAGLLMTTIAVSCQTCSIMYLCFRFYLEFNFKWSELKSLRKKLKTILGSVRQGFYEMLSNVNWLEDVSREEVLAKAKGV